MNNIRRKILLIVLVLSCSTVVFTQSGGTFAITKSVIAGGGGRATGGSFIVDGTIGQSIAGTQSNGANFSIISGFWGGGGIAAPVQRAPFDFDGDGKTDI